MQGQRQERPLCVVEMPLRALVGGAEGAGWGWEGVI